MNEVFDFFTYPLITIGDRSFDLVYILVQLILPVVLVFVLSKVLRKMIFVFAGSGKKAKTDEDLEEKKNVREKHRMIFRAINILSSISLFIIAFRFLILLLSLKQISSVFTEPFYSSGNLELSFLTFIQIIVLVYLANLCAKVFSSLFKKYTTRFIKHKNVSIVHILIRYGILVFIILIGLPIVGIDVGTLNIILGALGFGIGFGMQDLVGNFISGITIGSSRIISEGDRIVIGDIEGRVQQVNILTTVVRNLGGDELIVPNKHITGNPVHNYTHSDKIYTVHGSVEVSYHSDLHLVGRLMVDAAKSLSYRDEESEIFYRVKSFENSGIKVAVYVSIKDVSNRYAAISDLNLKIWELFRQHDIQIPFPQMDLHVKSIHHEDIKNNESKEST